MIKSGINWIKRKFHNRNWESKRKYLICQGAKIGEKTRLFCNTSAFGSEPYLIEVGEDCVLASDVHLVTHDGGIKVLNSMGYFNGERRSKMGRIRIGNNVYIGVGALIMPNVTIGDNCIIGACSVVTKDIPSNSVVAGVPARVLKDVDAYYHSLMEKGGVFYTREMRPAEKKQFLINNVPPLK